MKKFGIDVSTWNGRVDWNKVKNSGVEFAILRCGYGMNMEGQDDDTFIRNAKECERLGIPYGVYIYSYATNIVRAKSEAEHVLRLLKDRKVEYPIYLDLEDKSVSNIGKDAIFTVAKEFVKNIEAAGYYAGIYANLNWWENYLTDPWYDTVARWVAQYYTECQYKKEYGVWQYSSIGSVSGIDGKVDMNYAYVDYPKIIKESGKNHLNDFVKPTKSVEEVAKEVIDGKWGNGSERFDRLTKAGYNADAVQDKVNELLKTPAKPKKTVEEIAKEVIDGKWGNGDERFSKLEKAGYDSDAVQNKVNELLKTPSKPKKSIDEVAKEVIRGEWGNGQDRINRLKKAGYDPDAVQDRVNKLLK